MFVFNSIVCFIMLENKNSFHDQNETILLDPRIKEFLENSYLDSPYLVPEDIRDMITGAAEELVSTIPGFECVVNVGGTANGSLALRRLEKPNPASDLDIYFVGHSEMLPHLALASAVVATSARRIGLTLDGELSGKRAQNFLNLDTLLEHIEKAELDLLALPFGSAFGNTTKAQTAVLEAVINHTDKQAIWDEIATYHAQSLSMHHGSWPSELGNFILGNYYEQKIMKFGLPEEPEELLATLQGK